MRTRVRFNRSLQEGPIASSNVEKDQIYAFKRYTINKHEKAIRTRTSLTKKPFINGVEVSPFIAEKLSHLVEWK